jgi:hypothetical protein
MGYIKRKSINNTFVLTCKHCLWGCPISFSNPNLYYEHHWRFKESMGMPHFIFQPQFIFLNIIEGLRNQWACTISLSNPNLYYVHHWRFRVTTGQSQMRYHQYSCNVIPTQQHSCNTCIKLYCVVSPKKIPWLWGIINICSPII